MDESKPTIIRLAFTYQMEIVLFEICKKIIIYKDRKWEKGFQFMPKDPKIIKAIIYSRNKIRKEMIGWIEEANRGTNLVEYNNAKDDEELVSIIKRDAELKGLVFRKKMYITFDDKGNEIEVKK
jgi:hypothetical protein